MSSYYFDFFSDFARFRLPPSHFSERRLQASWWFPHRWDTGCWCPSQPWLPPGTWTPSPGGWSNFLTVAHLVELLLKHFMAKLHLLSLHLQLVLKIDPLQSLILQVFLGIFQLLLNSIMFRPNIVKLIYGSVPLIAKFLLFLLFLAFFKLFLLDAFDLLHTLNLTRPWPSHQAQYPHS